MGFARDVRHMERPAATVIVARTERVILDPAVGGQDVLPSPAAIAEGFPPVEILPLAADIDQGIDRTRPAQDLAARPVVDAIPETRNRLGEVHPIDAGVIERLAVADRDLHPGLPIRWTCFQQEGAVTPALGEAVRHPASGRTGTDDDEI